MVPITTLQLPDLPLDPPGRDTHAYVNRKGFTADTVRSRGTQVIHQHPCYEMIFVHSGTALLSSPQWTSILVPGDIVVFHGGTLHGTRPIHGLYVRSVMHFLPQALSGSAARLLAACADRPWLISLQPAAIESVRAALSQIRHAWQSRTSACGAGTLLADVLGEMQQAELSRPAAMIHPVVRDVLDYMMQQANTMVGLDQLSQRFYISKGHLCYLFQTHFGCSPQQMWQLIRIDRLCHQLATSRLPVGELAAAAGFASRSGLQRAFRRVTGTSVAEYRQLIEARSIAAPPR